MNKQFDVAAYVWPAYGQDSRAAIFWPEGRGEWQSVKSSVPKFQGHTQPRVPLWGYQDESDPRVMEMQIREATRHGVNVFIYDWYWYDRRPFLENCLNRGFLNAENCTDMKFYLMWANHDAMTLWDKRLSSQAEEIVWLGAQDRREFEIFGRRLVDAYFRRSNYYTIGGCPVFCIYDLDNLIRGMGSLAAARDALDWLRGETARAGFPGLHLQCILRRHLDYNVTGIGSDNIGVQKDVVEALGFDSLTHYQFCHFLPIGDYREMVRGAAKEWEAVDRDYKIPYFPHVSVGWDNNPRFEQFRGDVTTGNTPEEFRRGLEMAREYLESRSFQPPLVTVNSWNEWTETSYLLPDTLNGYGYLESVRAVFGTAERRSPVYNLHSAAL